MTHLPTLSHLRTHAYPMPTYLPMHTYAHQRMHTDLSMIHTDMRTYRRTYYTYLDLSALSYVCVMHACMCRASALQGFDSPVHTQSQRNFPTFHAYSVISTENCVVMWNAQVGRK